MLLRRSVIRWTVASRRCMATEPPKIINKVFVDRHIGPSKEERIEMLNELGLSSLREMIDKATPDSIRLNRELDIRPAIDETELLKEAATLSAKNEVWRSYLGQGYYGTITPPVILRNMFENPGWITQYTPYQAEISQGRLENLVNFQTIVAELTGMEIANASLLDEASATAEAVGVMTRLKKKYKVLIDANCHPQILSVVNTFSDGYGVEPVVVDLFDDPKVEKMLESGEYSGVVVSYPDTNGSCRNLSSLVYNVHKHSGLVTCITDLQACTLLKPVSLIKSKHKKQLTKF